MSTNSEQQDGPEDTEEVWISAFRSTWAYKERVDEEVRLRWPGRREFWHHLLDLYFSGRTRRPSIHPLERLTAEERESLVERLDVVAIELRGVRRMLASTARGLVESGNAALARELQHAVREARNRLRSIMSLSR